MNPANTARPRVLYLAPDYPSNGSNAAQVRARKLLPLLAESVDLRVIGFSNLTANAADPAVRDKLSIVRPRALGGRVVMQSLVSPLPRSFFRCTSPTAQRLFADCLADFQPDIVHVDTFRMLGLAATQQYPAKTVMHIHDAISKKVPGWSEAKGGWLSRIDYAIQGRRIRAAEDRMLPSGDICIVDSLEDRDHLARQTGANVTVVPLGFDENEYHPDGEAEDLGSEAIVFSGGMGSVQSVDAARWLLSEIMPLVWQQRPQARVFLVGSKPAPELVAAAESDTRIQVTGFVEHLPRYLRGASVYACPLKIGSGMRTRVVEAFACGCPIVSTSFSLVGLDTPDDAHGNLCLIADDARTFANSVIELLGRRNTARSDIGQMAAEFALRNFSWRATTARVMGLYAQLIDVSRLTEGVEPTYDANC